MFRFGKKLQTKIKTMFLSEKIDRANEIGELGLF